MTDDPKPAASSVVRKVEFQHKACDAAAKLRELADEFDKHPPRVCLVLIEYDRDRQPDLVWTGPETSNPYCAGLLLNGAMQLVNPGA